MWGGEASDACMARLPAWARGIRGHVLGLGLGWLRLFLATWQDLHHHVELNLT